MNLSPIDIGCLIVIAAFVIKALLRGFIKELFSLIALIGGLVLAWIFSAPAASLVVQYLGIRELAPAIAFLLIFVGFVVLVKLVELLLKKVVEAIDLEGLDRILGGLFGLGQGIAVCALVLTIIEIQPFFDASAHLSGSMAARILLPLVPQSLREFRINLPV